MTERVETVEELKRRLAELRAIHRRLEQRRLEDDDWAKVHALLSEAIDQAEPGQQWVTNELSDEEQTLVRQTNEGLDGEEPK